MAVERVRLQNRFQLKTPVNQWEFENEADDEESLRYFSILLETENGSCPCRECNHTDQHDCHLLDMADNHPLCCLECCDS